MTFESLKINQIYTAEEIYAEHGIVFNTRVQKCKNTNTVFLRVREDNILDESHPDGFLDADTFQFSGTIEQNQSHIRKIKNKTLIQHSSKGIHIYSLEIKDHNESPRFKYLGNFKHHSHQFGCGNFRSVIFKLTRENVAHD